MSNTPIPTMNIISTKIILTQYIERRIKINDTGLFIFYQFEKTNLFI